MPAARLQKGRDADVEAPDVERHDEVYFRHASGPLCGKVLSRGKHGCVVEADGKRHKVRWDSFLGHRQKAHVTAKVVDQGDDGLIVEHAGGGRRFIRDPIGLIDPEEAIGPAPKLRKAIDLPVLLPAEPELIKALAGRPGLRLEDRTDKTGRHTRRWVKTSKDEPGERRHAKGGGAAALGQHNVKPGHHVKFKAGAFEGEGHVVGEPGRHGAHVRDHTGRQHQVLYEEITHHRGQPRAAAGGGSDDGGDGDKPKGDDFVATDFAKQFDKDDLSEDHILADLDDEARQKVAEATEKVRSLKQTVDQYKSGDDYDVERQAAHRQIFQRFINSETIAAATPADGEAPTLTLLGGRGGSGKSQLDGMVYDSKKAIVVDPDEIKSMLPEYQGWNAHEVHEESSDIASTILGIARTLGLNVVLDGTMKNADSSLKRIGQFRAEGYRVEAHYMHLPRPVAAKRAIQRFLSAKGDGPGRFVPVSVLVGNTTNEATFDKVRQHADAWSFHDNQGEKGSKPKLIASGGKKQQNS